MNEFTNGYPKNWWALEKMYLQQKKSGVQIFRYLKVALWEMESL